MTKLSRATREPYHPKTPELEGFRMELRHGPSGKPAAPERYELLAYVPKVGVIRAQLEVPMLNEEQLSSACLQLEPHLLKSINRLRFQ